jgi:ABC-type multidrug transport system fused ATPase/permease subunit
MVESSEGIDPSSLPEPAAPQRSFGFRDAVRLVASAGRPAALVAFATAAVLTGLLEASVILVVIGIAAALADGSSAVALSFGPVDASISTGQGVLVGLGLTVLLVACATPSAWLEARMAARFLARIRTRLLRALVAASWERQSAVVEARFQDLAAVHTFKVAGLVMILTIFATNVLGLLTLVVAAFVIDMVTAGALLVIVAVLAVAFRPLTRSIRRRSQVHLAAHVDYVELLADSFAVLPEVRVFGVRDAAADRVEEANLRTASEYRHMMFRGRLIPSLYLGATAALLLLGLALAGTQGDLGLTKAGAIVIFLLRALRYSQQVQAGWQAVMEQVPYLERIEEALDEWKPAPGEFGSRTLGRIGVLEFDGAGYVYPTGQVGIEDLTVQIRHGEVVGLEGPSGAGKSTLGQLVLGLRRPTSGAYLIDGIRVEEFDEASWYSRFAYVAQDSRLIQGDIRDNVRFLRPEISEEAIDRALQEAGIGQDIARWADGVGHQVGSGGRELSGGQRQRIAIARALARDPDVLVMDEPTSALDRESEEIVRSTLSALRGRITVILIAHRESTLTVCDRILTVAEHRVQERVVPSWGRGAVDRPSARPLGSPP